MTRPNTTTRRTALAGAAALAAPVTLPLLPAFATPTDPVLAVYAEWWAMRAEYLQVLANYSALERRYGNCSPESDAYNDGPVVRETDRIMECEARIAGMVATTAAGIAAQLRVMAFAYGHFDKCADDNTQARFVRSLLAGAERIAEGGVS